MNGVFQAKGRAKVIIKKKKKGMVHSTTSNKLGVWLQLNEQEVEWQGVGLEQ